MTFKLQGREQVTFLASGGLELFQQGFLGLGVLVLSVGVLLPFLKIIGTLYVLIPLEFNLVVWKAKETFKFVEAITPWAMMEVLMLGVIVAYVKLIDITTIVLGTSLYSFAALIIFMTMSAAALEPLEVWARLEQRP
jgi:paraquat-inducible protein A